MKSVLSFVKRLLPPSFWLRKKMSQIYHHPVSFFRRPKTGSVESAIDALAKNKNKVNFVQVGSNDGVTSDPIYPYIVNSNFCGVKTEPISYIYLQLKENFKEFPCVKCLNIAIAEENSQMPFYRLKEFDEKGVRILHNQQGSFIREQLLSLRDIYEDIENLIQIDLVETWTLPKLFNSVKGNIDFLHIDAEGYDYIILKQLELCSHDPELIIFENVNLSKEDYCSAISFLRQKGYDLSECFGDTIAKKIKK